MRPGAPGGYLSSLTPDTELCALLCGIQVPLSHPTSSSTSFDQPNVVANPNYDTGESI